MHESKEKNWYINGRLSDTFFIILCPLIALAIVTMICEPRHENYAYTNLTPAWFAVFASVLTHAHILLVFTRSHLNKKIFVKYKYRFTLIPLISLLAMWMSPFVFLVMTTIGLYWDEWHSLMQTFGFGRIYDSKLGNDPLYGRKLDMGMAFVVGFLPSVILLTYLPDSKNNLALGEFMELPLAYINKFSWLISGARYPLIFLGIAYILFYSFAYFKLIKNGYRYSLAKLTLFLVTGSASIYIACRYTVADGVFFGNIYHALQYIFIVMVSERENLSNLVSNSKSNAKNLKPGYIIYFVLIIPMVFIFSGVRQISQHVEYLAEFWLLTSLLHFWFDGFIWSVRRQDLA